MALVFIQVEPFCKVKRQAPSHRTEVQHITQENIMKSIVAMNAALPSGMTDGSRKHTPGAAGQLSGIPLETTMAQSDANVTPAGRLKQSLAIETSIIIIPTIQISLLISSTQGRSPNRPFLVPFGIMKSLLIWLQDIPKQQRKLRQIASRRIRRRCAVCRSNQKHGPNSLPVP